jgi:hypothetical protein
VSALVCRLVVHRLGEDEPDGRLLFTQVLLGDGFYST